MLQFSRMSDRSHHAGTVGFATATGNCDTFIYLNVRASLQTARKLSSDAYNVSRFSRFEKSNVRMVLTTTAGLHSGNPLKHWYKKMDMSVKDYFTTINAMLFITQKLMSAIIVMVVRAIVVQN